MVRTYLETAPGEPIISVKGLGCQAGNRYLLRDINWEVQAGEPWVVFGLNGCGKTTLLSIISGYKMPTEGTVKVFGQEYTNENILELRKRIGWVSSSYFDKHYTKESALNIVLSGLCGTLGMDSTVKPDDYIRAKELLREWHMDRKFDMPFSVLSKGERQNILIARALISNPEIMVLDEPGTGLDVLAREMLLERIQKFVEDEKKTVIYVTHYPEEILSDFKHCLVLREGYIVDKGSMDDIMTTERMSADMEAPVRIEQLSDGRRDLRVQKGVRW